MEFNNDVEEGDGTLFTSSSFEMLDVLTGVDEGAKKRDRGFLYDESISERSCGGPRIKSAIFSEVDSFEYDETGCGEDG